MQTGYEKSWVLVINFFSNLKTIFTVCLLVVISSRSGSRYFARTYEALLAAHIIGLKGGQSSVSYLWTFQRPQRCVILENLGFKFL